MQDKRKRSPDFSEQETRTLLEIVGSHKSLLFGTGGKGTSKEEKAKERNWKKAAAVLSTAGGPCREWTAVRKKWRDLTSKAKAYKAPQTGGGPPVPNDPILDRVLDIMAREVISGILSEDDSATSSQETDAEPPTNESDFEEVSPGPTAPAPRITSSRPAAVRQCEIQEELLSIQIKKLQAKREQNEMLRSILGVLHGISIGQSVHAH